MKYLKAGIVSSTRMLSLVIALAVAACGSDSALPTEGGSGGGGGSGGQNPPAPGQLALEIEYSTFLGGSEREEIREPVLLPGGRILFGARTRSLDVPITGGAYQPSYGSGEGDSYLGILSADGTRLDAATYFGGSGMERPPYGIAIARNGDVVFGSGTTSPNIPTSGNAYRLNIHQPVPNPGGGYVCRISPDLRALRWCTYTGGGWPRGGLILDPQDNVLVMGKATANDYSTTPGALQTQRLGADDGFILKLTADGSSAIFSTRLGGTGTQLGESVLAMRLDAQGNMSIAGITQSTDFPTTAGAAQTVSGGAGSRDGFVARVDASGTYLLYSSFMGGSGQDFVEHGLALLPDGSVLVAGVTQSPDFPGAGTLQGQGDGFLAKVNPSGSAFSFTTYIGGPGTEQILSPVVDSKGNIYVAGLTSSRNLPVTAGALQSTYGGGPDDAVLYAFRPNGSLLYATYLGGSGHDLIRGIAIGPADEVYLVGRTDSDDFPITAGAFQTTRGGMHDGFVMKLVLQSN